MNQTHKQILSAKAVTQKIRRMAFEVLENNLEESEILLVGVYDKGFHIAEVLKVELESICEIPVSLVQLEIDKSNPRFSDIAINVSGDEIKERAVVLVDDVLNSGKTTAYALAYLLQFNAKKIEIATLVNRSHKAFPIMPTYKGYEIATMIDEYIEVITKESFGVYLHS
ncbi:MAG: phosphoribosyltransferase family protein [Bacteroidota bacterium]